MLVGEWMTRDPVTVTADATVGEAAATMSRGRFRRLPVVDGEVLVGIISRGDLLRAAPADVNPFSVEGTSAPALARAVREVMSESPRTVTPEAPLEVAAELLTMHKIGAAPVVSKQGLVGIVTDSDIFRAFSAAFGGTVPGIRVTFEAQPGEDVFATAFTLAQRHHMAIASAARVRQDDRVTFVVRFLGNDSSGLVEALWDSGHRVVSVHRF